MDERPITKEITEGICTYLLAGVGERDAAAAMGVSEKTFQAWMRRGREALDEKSRAEGSYKAFYRAVREAQARFKLKSLTHIAGASEKSWQASAWLLEKCCPDEYGKGREGEREEEGGGAGRVTIYLPDNGRG